MLLRGLLVVISLSMAALVMVIHEFIKTFVYYIYLIKNNEVEESSKTFKNIFKFWRYLDPIGLIFAVTNCGIFSKQYPFLIKSKKAAILIGVSGLLSMLCLSLISAFLFTNFFGEATIIGVCLEYVVYHSITMFLINFFPVVSYDISLIAAGSAPNIFIKIRKYDAIIKLLLMILIILGIYAQIGLFTASFLLLQ